MENAMNVESRSMGEFLRFVITGYAFYMVAKIVGFTQHLRVLSPSGELEKQLQIVTAGAILYYAFRTVVYPILLSRIIDRINPAMSIRTAVRNGPMEDSQASSQSTEAPAKARKITWAESNDVYHLAIHGKPELDVDRDRLWSHSIHMLLICGILAMAGCLYALVACLFLKALILFVVAILLLVSGGCSDVALERRIYRNIAILHRAQLNDILTDYFARRAKAIATAG
jgi:hypothetical protein